MYCARSESLTGEIVTNKAMAIWFFGVQTLTTVYLVLI